MLIVLNTQIKTRFSTQYQEYVHEPAGAGVPNKKLDGGKGSTQVTFHDVTPSICIARPNISDETRPTCISSRNLVIETATLLVVFVHCHETTATLQADHRIDFG